MGIADALGNLGKVNLNQGRYEPAQEQLSLALEINRDMANKQVIAHTLSNLAIIADFELDIDSPYELPEKTSLQSKPDKVPYNQHKIGRKHYGRSIVLMIEKAVELEEGEEKQDLIRMIAYHMKKSYLTWNREAVSDEEIIMDLKTLSGGKLEVSSDLKLPETKDILAKNRPQHTGGKKQGGKKQGGKKHKQQQS